MSVAGAAFVIRWAKQQRIKRQYPVEGNYISFFEDIEEGKSIVVPSEATVTQKGRSLEIVNRLDNGRSWTLHGSILPGGHISGVYSADSSYDEGVGAYYLRIGEGTFDGMWSGYDHVNKVTTSGRYWFRLKKDPHIRAIEEKDINDVLHTAAIAFGNGYLDPNELKHTDKNFTIVASVDKEFAGFCNCYILPPEAAEEVTKSVRKEIPDDIHFADSKGTLAVIKTIAVLKKFHGHGIGSALFKFFEEKLIKNGAECIIVPAWDIGGENGMSGLLKRPGYWAWKSDPEYWKEDCEAGKYKCVAFEKSFVCSVTFYAKSQL